ncbi:MAG TPA: hypothetical protein PK467_08300 [Candidatus Wallbacteria bacterium]|nr:hypothetical protein [Candidatus Wallbacteria bacterium]
MSLNDIDLSRTANGETDPLKMQGIKQGDVKPAPVSVYAADQPLPPYIKVDCDVDEEITYPGCGCALMLGGIFLSNIADRTFLEYPAYAVIAAGALGLISRYFIDNFYVINTSDRKIYYRRSVLGKTSLKFFCAPEDIYAVSVAGRHNSGKSGEWWDYRVVLIKKNGERIDFGNAVKADAPDELNRTAIGMAGVLQCGYIECPAAHEMIIHKLDGRTQVFFHKKG